ncbi:MAG TPA: tRNA (N6-isopentenyl adenosine(37)-C2)-methylthiotransferase MiaB [Sulfurimonas sp.]|nr:tRNA (N6-isopentenyl adenosine(37)-C2)-methylthiotransferase MiaB [Sulfurimonas sp.]
MSKTVFIETLGCAMNERDTEHMIAELNAKEDYVQTDDSTTADLIIINTCSVRERPVHKLFSELGSFNKYKKQGAKIGVTGCTASHLGKDIIKRAPYVDFVLGARNVSKITEVIHKPKAVEIDIDYDESEFAFKEFRGSIHKAFVNISIGCDKACTFCIVPKTRGDEISIPTDLILQECERATQAGAQEIFLLGQNVNNYGRRFSGDHEKVNFTELLRRISKIDTVKRIRFTSPHPFHMDDEFLEEFSANDKICKSMHMPLQSGSSAILKMMKRGYTKEWFLNRAKKLREMVPNVSISTDIIVAFPGETQEDFEETIDVMRQVRFDQVFSFKYSPRPLTEAALMTNEVEAEVGSERLAYLQGFQNSITDDITNACLGKIYEVFFEDTRDGGYIAGRSDNNLMIKVEGDESLIGSFAKVRVIKTGRMAQIGELVE